MMNHLIYLIDDDDDVREVLEYALKEDGFRVSSFADPTVALSHIISAAPQDLPALILVDQYMPQMTGTEFILRLRTHLPDILSRIPIILCSGAGELLLEEAGCGPIKQLSKPIGLRELLGAVHSSL